MDRLFVYKDQPFVWDPAKATENIVRHGVSFEEACEIFFDPFRIIKDASVNNEDRDAAIGVTNDMSTLFVVYLEREESTVRIISA